MTAATAIDFHCHWMPDALAEALRARTTPPRIAPADDGTGGERLIVDKETLPFDAGYTDVERRLAFMDGAGVVLQALSLPGLFGVDSLPAAAAAPLVGLFNDRLGALVAAHPDRFAGMAALPLANGQACRAELRRAVRELGLIGAILPADGFLDRRAAAAFEPLFEEANALGAHLFIHPGPLPGPAGNGDGHGAGDEPPEDNENQRHIVLDVQARLSAVSVTLCMTDFLDAFPNVTVQVANLGGSIPLLAERLDHVAWRRNFPGGTPSGRFGRIHVDTSSFGPRAIALTARVFGADRVLVGTDHPVFDTAWVLDGLADSGLEEAEQMAIRRGNAAAILERERG
jgi:predicted TIM-barrel fold metal-dependent hydrolase